MIITIYGICKDEESNIERFVETTKKADHIHILDTGSSDNSVSSLRKALIHVHQSIIDPWRFDVARNQVLQSLPKSDLCLSLDFDEYLVDGWRDHIESAYCQGVTRLRYKYRQNNGDPFMNDKCHSRDGYRWVRPIHETVQPIIGFAENVVESDFTVVHTPSDRIREYVDLCEIAIAERPFDSRLLLFCIEEYYRSSRDDKVVEVVKQFLESDDISDQDRSYATYFLAIISDNKDDMLYHGSISVLEAPMYRSAWHRLSRLALSLKKYRIALKAAEHALSINHTKINYYDLDQSSEIYCIAARSAKHFDRGLAESFYKKGMKIYPNDVELAREYANFSQ